MSQATKKHRKQTIRRMIILVVLLIVLPAAYLVYQSTRDNTTEIKSAALATGDIQSSMSITARIVPGQIQEAHVGSQLVQRVSVKKGDQVKKGDTLIVFDLSDLEKQAEDATDMRLKAEETVADVIEQVQEQADGSTGSLIAIQKQVTGLSTGISSSLNALAALSGTTPVDVTFNQALLEDIANRLAAVDPAAPEAQDQITSLIAELELVVQITESEDYRKQINRLQSGLKSTSKASDGLLGTLSDPEFLALLSSGSAADQVETLVSTARTTLIQALTAEQAAKQNLEQAVKEIKADFDGVVVDIKAVAGEYTGDGPDSGLAGNLGSSDLTAGLSDDLTANLPEGWENSLSGLDLGSALGNAASKTSRVLVLYDNARPLATFQANRFDSARLSIGMPVVYHQDGVVYHGEITYKSKIASSIDVDAGLSSGSLFDNMASAGGLAAEPMLDFEMSLLGDRLTDLTLGFNIEAEIQTASAEDVLLLPAEALKKELGEYYVYVVEDDGVIGDESHLVRKVVVPGIQSDTHAEVLSGLEAGMRIVLNPTNDLSDGMTVRDISRG